MDAGAVHLAIQTSWVRVKGPKDLLTCRWCARWVGQLVPAEDQEGHAARHDLEARAGPCRCWFEPAGHRLEPQDPAWLGA